LQAYEWLGSCREQMGFVVPTLDTFMLGLMFGLLGIPLTYYPMQSIIESRKIKTPWITHSKKHLKL